MLVVAVAVTAMGAFLAIGAGLSKLVRPEGAVLAMRGVGLVSNVTVVRLGAVLECCVGTLVLASSSWVPACLLTVTYLGFSGFVLAAMHVRSAAPCGCFGSATAPLGARHLVVDLVVAVSAAATVAHRLAAPSTLARPTGSAIAVLALGACSALLAATVLTREEPA